MSQLNCNPPPPAPGGQYKPPIVIELVHKESKETAVPGQKVKNHHLVKMMTKNI